MNRCETRHVPYLLFLLFFLSFSAVLHAENKSADLDLSGLSLSGIHVLPTEKRVKALNFRLKTLRSGEEVTISNYKDQVLVLNFWASWCPPCRAEMPAIEALHQELKDEGLTWLGINSGEDRKTVADYINKFHYTFPILLDPENSSLYKYGIQSLPATIIVNKYGYIVALAIGSLDWRNQNVIAAFRKLLAE